MRVLIACKRGNVAERDPWGHCLCVECKAFQKAQRAARGSRAAYKRAWNLRNPEKAGQYTAKWSAANKAKREAAVKSWRDRNPDKVAAMSARAGRKWSANNKGKRNASVRARQLALRQRMPSWANKAQIEAFYLEAAALTLATGVPHEVDHIIPLQCNMVSGLHIPANLRVIPRSQNRSKGNRFEGVS